jgi:hypothetical protein
LRASPTPTPGSTHKRAGALKASAALHFATRSRAARAAAVDLLGLFAVTCDASSLPRLGSCPPQGSSVGSGLLLGPWFPPVPSSKRPRGPPRFQGHQNPRRRLGGRASLGPMGEVIRAEVRVYHREQRRSGLMRVSPPVVAEEPATVAPEAPSLHTEKDANLHISQPFLARRSAAPGAPRRRRQRVADGLVGVLRGWWSEKKLWEYPQPPARTLRNC